jgi:hypothetical protein
MMLSILVPLIATILLFQPVSGGSYVDLRD